MNINAKQLSTIDYTRMDITTALQAFDDAYAQARKWAATSFVE